MGINIINLVSQVVIFFILLLGLRIWVYPALMKTLDQRAVTIREGVENAQRAREELERAQQRVEDLLEQARRDAQETLAKATQAGEHLRGEIEQQARARAQEILAQAEKQVQQEIAQAKAELRQEVADLAILAAERVIAASLDSQANRRLVTEFVAHARDLS